MKRSDERAVSFLLALSLVLVSALGACTTANPSKTPQATKTQASLPTPMVRIIPLWFPTPKKSFCMWFRFTVTANGAIANEQLVGGLSMGKSDISRYVQSTANTLAEYKYFPRKVDGKPVATPNVIQAYLNDAAKSKSEELSIAWTCNQPLLVTPRPVLVLPPAATAGAPAMAPGSANGSDGAQFAVRIKNMPVGASAMHGSAAVKIEFCVDPTGHVANATPSGGDIAAQALALEALDAVPFSPRGSSAPPNVRGLLMRAPKIASNPYRPLVSVYTLGTVRGHSTNSFPHSKPQWSCGLETRVNVFSHPENGAIATIERASIVAISEQPPKAKRAGS